MENTFDKDKARERFYKEYPESNQMKKSKPLILTHEVIEKIITLHPVAYNTEIAKKVGMRDSHFQILIRQLKKRGLLVDKRKTHASLIEHINKILDEYEQLKKNKL